VSHMNFGTLLLAIQVVLVVGAVAWIAYWWFK
jgi:hypothetical protein